LSKELWAGLMRILIVGGSSSVARALQPVLSAFAEVLTAGRKNCDVPLDLSWQDERFRLPEGIDAVVHLAAHFGGKDFDAMCAAGQVNVLGSLKMCHACTRAGVGHLVLISSIFAGLTEESPFYGIYALSKRHAEEVARLYSSGFNLPLTILRLAQIYGVGESFRKHQPFLYGIIDKAENNEEIVFYGSHDAQRNLIHAEDVAEIIARVVQQRIEGSYACPNPANVRYSEIAQAAISAFGSASTVRFAQDKPDIADNAFPPDDRLYRRIGFFPRVHLEVGIAKEAARRKGSP
jgi:nucleoside-diphosphate-sugar epimerase